MTDDPLFNPARLAELQAHYTRANRAAGESTRARTRAAAARLTKEPAMALNIQDPTFHEHITHLKTMLQLWGLAHGDPRAADLQEAHDRALISYGTHLALQHLSQPTRVLITDATYRNDDRVTTRPSDQ